MTVKKYRFFGGFISKQQKWLNEMASKGYRLVRTTKLMYEFEPCKEGEYQYAVEFIGHYSYEKAKEYRKFLEEFGYRTFTKNINLNYSIGKVKIRPWGKGVGMIATNPGTFNKELLILEKKNDGKPFELHTDTCDKVEYYKPLRNAYLSTFLLFLCASIWMKIDETASFGSFLAFGILAVLFLIPTVWYQVLIRKMKKETQIKE